MQLDGSGSEDCLFLNVFTPTKALANRNAKLPVMVWIHGGAYIGGSSNDYDATNLVAAAGIPVVTVNYRLSIFGFLGSEQMRRLDVANGSTGNSGLQDQRAALLWVRDNAHNFGGDPERVTIFGESAGAASVSCHMAAPASAPYFHRAVVESGSFSSWVARSLEFAEKVYAQVLHATGCADLACLEALPVESLLDATLSIPAGLCCGNQQGAAYVSWAPTVDGVELTQDPYEAVQRARVHRVPLLHGTNTDEGSMFINVPQLLLRKELMADWARWYGPTMGDGAANDLSALYLEANVSYPTGLGTREWWAAQRSLTDQAFACAARMASHGLGESLPVFQYLFEPATHKNVQHGMEVEYLFLMDDLKGEDLRLAMQMVALWSSFAADGRPSLPPLSGEAAAWDRFDPTMDGPYMRLNVQHAGGLTTDHHFRRETCEGFFNEWAERALKRAAS